MKVRFFCVLCVFVLLPCYASQTVDNNKLLDSYNKNGDYGVKKTDDTFKNETLAMLELCLDLDSEDDRYPSPALGSVPRAVNYMNEDRIKGWKKIEDSRNMVSAHDNKNLNENSCKTKDYGTKCSHNPSINGFGYYNSAWTLWQFQGKPIYALVFRGTVMSNNESIYEDIQVGTIPAKNGLELESKQLPITFAEIPRSEIHSGFAYATFQQLFLKKYGALNKLKDLPPNATIILSGHSQGAAIATLAHAFLYHEIHPLDGSTRFGLKKNWQIKSYVFAQPRPGNLQFSLDFGRINQIDSPSYVFQNTHDPITMVPETRALILDALADSAEESGTISFPWKSWVKSLNDNWIMNEIKKSEIGSYVVDGLVNREVDFAISTTSKVVTGSDNSLNNLRSHVSGLLEHGVTKHLTENTLNAYIENEALQQQADATTAVSQSYMSAGSVIALIGTNNPQCYFNNPDDKKDTFFQHHASTYRRLLEDYFGIEPSNEDNMKKFLH